MGLTREQLPDRVIPISSVGPASLGFKPPPQAELLTSPTSSNLLSTPTLHAPAQESMNPRELPSRDTSTNIQTASPLPPLSPSSTASPKPHHELTEGEIIRHPISYPNISINVRTTRLNLNLSSDTTVSLNPDIPSNPSSRCLVRVKWLQDTETGNVNSQAINAEGLGYDTEMEFYHGATRTPTELHLRRGEDLVSIKYTFDEPRWDWNCLAILRCYLTLVSCCWAFFCPISTRRNTEVTRSYSQVGQLAQALHKAVREVEDFAINLLEALGNVHRQLEDWASTPRYVQHKCSSLQNAER